MNAIEKWLRKLNVIYLFPLQCKVKATVDRKSKCDFYHSKRSQAKQI